MSNEFTLKLINFGLTFSNCDVSLRVQDLKLLDKKTPIVYQHNLKPWSQTDSDIQIGEATLYTENFRLFAECKFNYDIMLTQPSHDHIIIGVPSKRLSAFNSMSLLLKKLSIERSPQNELAPNLIKNAIIENLSFVDILADPGIYIHVEPASPSLMLANPNYNPNQAIVYTGPTINKNILI